MGSKKAKPKMFPLNAATDKRGVGDMQEDTAQPTEPTPRWQQYRPGGLARSLLRLARTRNPRRLIARSHGVTPSHSGHGVKRWAAESWF